MSSLRILPQTSGRHDVLHEHQLAGVIRLAADEDEPLPIGERIVGRMPWVREKSSSEERGAVPGLSRAVAGGALMRGSRGSPPPWERDAVMRNLRSRPSN